MSVLTRLFTEELPVPANPVQASTDADPLSVSQRIALRDLLHMLWREHVIEITNLAVRFHTTEDPELAAALAKVRRSLVDVEAALNRLESRSYGRCDGCDRRIAFEQLEAEPWTRYCRRCYSA